MITNDERRTLVGQHPKANDIRMTTCSSISEIVSPKHGSPLLRG